MRIRRDELLLLARCALEAELQKANKNMPVVIDSRAIIEAVENDRHIHVVPMPKMVVPEVPEQPECSIPYGTPDWHATRCHMRPNDRLGNVLVDLFLAADEEQREEIKRAPSLGARWNQQVETAVKLEERAAGGPVCEWTPSTVVETRRERVLREHGIYL